SADDRKRQSFMHDASIGKRLCEGFERWSDLRGGRENAIVWKHRDIVLRKVDTCFKRCDEFHQLLLDRLDAARKYAFELLRSNLGLEESLGLDEVAHSLGLRQIDASMEKPTHGELTRLR